ncbi:MAG: bifunctional (p)ppGpp synthetase/guanosine-3',5'-bis(diphosphate) 3'-pyrophosphohydrolase, partial [Chloroflexi bacterium]|nr:bifunctional (p)ppGpp synthetase/guanosine-3',5'-bis(diphosphate) 3'-pyrophosphohydrolase [Chloroflexota bacterium]
MVTAVRDLLEKTKSYLPADKERLVEEALEFAQEKHQGQKRVSGGPYFEHPLQTAHLLADLHFDGDTLAAALLHDVVEDCGVTPAQLTEKFGEEISRLVDGVTKLSRIDLRTSGVGKHAAETAHGQAESIRKMLVAMAQDIRVVIIKLADRLHNMRTLEALPPQQRLAIAQETLDIYAPLAHRLGMWDIKWQLEDLAFRYLQPEEYHRVSRLLATRRQEREAYIEQVAKTLRRAFIENGIKAEVYGRPKHIFSVAQK